MFQTKVVEKIKTDILRSFFSKIVSFMRLTYKMPYSQRSHRWQCNTAHALCMLDNYGYKHTFRIYSTHCFSKATTVKRTRLSVTLHIPCL